MPTTTYRLVRWVTLAVLAASLPSAARAAGAGRPPALVPNRVSASAPLGTVVTVPVDLDNTGQPAGTAQLYEALAPTTALAFVPPADLRVPLPNEAGPISAQLIEKLQAAPDGTTEFILYLADQADLSAAAALPGWNERGSAVVDTLRAHAAQTQAGLLADMRSRGYQPVSYWIVNAIGVKGDKALAEWAAAQGSVALVAANEVHQLDEVVPASVDAAGATSEGLAWGIAQIGAPSVWADWGVRGRGIVVASIDTGVAYTHTALLETYRGWNGSSADHNYNWFDGTGEMPAPAPIDDFGHGTHVMGTMVGHAAGEFTALGVAPDARWIAARGCAGLFCTDTALIASAQWLLAPTNLAGGLPRPDLRPHIINNSWGKNEEDDWYIGYVQAWNASGIFSVFASGNNGTFAGCGSSGSPGQYAQAFSVGATDPDDFVADFSSRGPTSDGRIKPDLSAPGVAIASAWPGDGMRLLNGTSMAAPHVSGAAALLWSANPALMGDLAATQALLTGSALPLTSVECGPSAGAVPNNVYGWGRLDARQAVQSARVDVPWLSVPSSAELVADGVSQAALTLDARQVSAPGVYSARLLMVRANNLTAIPITFQVLPSANAAQVTGTLTDVWSAGPVYGRVQVGAGPLVQTDADGQFALTLPFGSYSLTAAATGYLSATQPLAVLGATSTSFSLVPDRPHLVLAADTPFSATLPFGERYTGTATVSNNGTQPLSVTASVASQEWVVDAAGASAGDLYDMSGVPNLTLDDDDVYDEPLALGFSLPIYGQLVSQIYVSSNGWISVQPAGSAAPFATCMTTASLPPGTLAPFWADLDPSLGGAVRAAQVDPKTFVVSYEKLAHWQAEPVASAPTYTFQIVLHASGEVDFIFGAMGELPARWAVGTYFDSGRAQSLACFKTPAALAHKRWTLHNQPPVSIWLSTAVPNFAVPPGGSVNLSVVLKGFGYVPWLTRPYHGVVRLTSNDPAQPSVDVPAQAVVGPPAVQLWMPLSGR